MNQVLRRIAIHGGLAAIFLGLLGMMLAELAGMWMAASLSAKPRSPAEIPANETAALRTRLPLTMAGLGFALVAIGELGLFALRKKPIPAPLGSEPAYDSTERLLEELLTQAEAKSPHLARSMVSQEQTSPNNSAMGSRHVPSSVEK